MRLGFGEISLVALAVMAGCSASSMSPAPGTVNGCAAGDFVTAAADAGTAQVRYGDPFGLVFSPNCMSIAAGQSVTFFGDTTQGSNFSVHPLRPGGADGTDPGTGGNPIVAQNSGSSYTVVFRTPGTYGFFCQTHQGMGMYGAVQVK